MCGKWISSKLEALKAEWEKWQGEPSHWHNLDAYFKPIVTRFFITWFATAPIISSVMRKYPKLIILPFDWWILWLASLSYAIAFAIHTFRCPQFIKRYPTYLAYQARGHSPRWLVWEFHKCWSEIDSEGQEKLETRVIEKQFACEVDEDTSLQGKPKVRKEGTVFQFAKTGKSYNVVVDETATDEFVKDFFWEVFGRWTSSDSPMRKATWLCLLAALVLVVFTVFQDIWFVISLLF
ncbi:hypothetical protein Q8W25_01085 [Shimia thalassica]|uniref:hypothetical protein n=1 Tax=Shimia thalassica TaxID=1715693 RepID=UPI002733F0D5|nr:hypothetical protein [Shimia thalassica]MDP2492582.1 hypothetical protein [Shimia thalassica]